MEHAYSEGRDIYLTVYDKEMEALERMSSRLTGKSPTQQLTKLLFISI